MSTDVSIDTDHTVSLQAVGKPQITLAQTTSAAKASMLKPAEFASPPCGMSPFPKNRRQAVPWPGSFAPHRSISTLFKQTTSIMEPRFRILRPVLRNPGQKPTGAAEYIPQISSISFGPGKHSIPWGKKYIPQNSWLWVRPLFWGSFFGVCRGLWVLG